MAFETLRTNALRAAPLTLGEAFRNRHNNVLLVRLMMSMIIVFSHSFPLSSGAEPGDPLKQLTGAWWGSSGITIGYSVVDLFFVISGFLVTHSFVRNPSVRDFAVKRFWRIWPAYTMAALMCLLVIGPVVMGQWPALPFSGWPWFWFETLILDGYVIPGVFVNNPMPEVLNGSMWTIKYEVMCYVFIVLTWWLGIVQKRAWIVGLFAACAVYFGLQTAGWLAGTALELRIPAKISMFIGEADNWPRLLTCYLAGMTLYVLRDELPYGPAWSVAALVALLGLGLAGEALLLPLIPLLLGYVVLSAGFSTVGRRHTSWVDRFDLSFGVYLYAFPIQQAIVHFVPAVRGEPLLLFALAYPSVLLVALISMRFVEQRFHVRKTMPATVG